MEHETANEIEREYWKQWARIEAIRSKLHAEFVTPLSASLFERIKGHLSGEPHPTNQEPTDDH